MSGCDVASGIESLSRESEDWLLFCLFMGMLDEECVTGFGSWLLHSSDILFFFVS